MRALASAPSLRLRDRDPNACLASPTRSATPTSRRPPKVSATAAGQVFLRPQLICPEEVGLLRNKANKLSVFSNNIWGRGTADSDPTLYISDGRGIPYVASWMDGCIRKNAELYFISPPHVGSAGGRRSSV